MEYGGAMRPAGYAPHVDGLRGVSIAAVVVFHLWPDALPGGFTGVDVFFVISGFLITQHLRSSLAAGALSIRDFYARRIRRLFPSLLVVLTATLALGFWQLLAHEWKQLGEHTMGGLAYVSNVLLWREGGYFAAPAQSKPLHHLWSLAVEEQFYLVWPWLLWLGNRLGRRGVGAVILAVIACSFSANLYLTLDEPNAAFHLPYGRLWELALGGAITFVSLRGRVTHVIGLAGAALVAVAFVITRSTGFPGFGVLLPTVGAAALILSPAGVAGRLLSTRPLVALGLISYPLYLWHWPLSVYARLTSSGIKPTHGALSNEAAAVVLLVSLVASALTWRFAEQPVRVRRVVPVGALLAASAALFVVGFSIFQGAIPTRWANARSAQYERAAGADLAPRDFKMAWQAPYYRYSVAGDERVPEVAFIGDSNMSQYGAALQARASRAPYRPFVVFATAGCPPFMEVEGCRGSVKGMKDAVADDNIKTVVIAADWSLYFDNTRFQVDGRTIPLTEGAFADFNAWLVEVARTRRVVLVTSIPTSPALAPVWMVRRTWFDGLQFDDAPLPRAALEARVEPVRRIIRAAGAAASATVIDPFDALCEAETCARDEGGAALYRDEHHVLPATLTRRFHAFDALLDPVP